MSSMHERPLCRTDNRRFFPVGFGGGSERSDPRFQRPNTVFGLPDLEITSLDRKWNASGVEMKSSGVEMEPSGQDERVSRHVEKVFRSGNESASSSREGFWTPKDASRHVAERFISCPEGSISRRDAFISCREAFLFQSPSISFPVGERPEFLRRRPISGLPLVETMAARHLHDP